MTTSLLSFLKTAVGAAAAAAVAQAPAVAFGILVLAVVVVLTVACSQRAHPRALELQHRPATAPRRKTKKTKKR